MYINFENTTSVARFKFHRINLERAGSTKIRHQNKKQTKNNNDGRMDEYLYRNYKKN